LFLICYCYVQFVILFFFLSLYHVYCLCVNVCCTAATWCQPNCGYVYIYLYIYIYIIYKLMVACLFKTRIPLTTPTVPSTCPCTCQNRQLYLATNVKSADFDLVSVRSILKFFYLSLGRLKCLLTETCSVLLISQSVLSSYAYYIVSESLTSIAFFRQCQS
jgi:hypothetical protein